MNVSKMNIKPILLVVLLGSLWMAGCTRAADDATETEGEMMEQETPARTAVAYIEPLAGNTVNGTATFEEVDGNVRIIATINALSPGEHGFHIHEGTSCDAYGGHFNPGDAPHGSPDEPERHVGDLGNLAVGEDSTAHYERVDAVLSLSGDPSIVGHAVIVHQGEDDYTTQPTGNAGPVIGCGVIQLQDAETGQEMM